LGTIVTIKAMSKMGERSAGNSSKRALLITVTCVGAYLVSLVVPFISPFTQYPLYVLKCGRLPIVGSTFAAGYTYRSPGDSNYGVSLFSDAFFCSEQEAVTAGFYKL
jgi:hypothetical protein